MTNRWVLVDLAVAHYSESKLSWLFVSLAQAHSCDSYDHIILLEFDCTSFSAFRRVYQVRLSIAVNNLETAQVFFAAVLLVDSNLLDG